MSKQKTIAFDLDDVLCYRPNQFEELGPSKYSYCVPNDEMIELANSSMMRDIKLSYIQQEECHNSTGM
jgi:hypothetical protein